MVRSRNNEGPSGLNKSVRNAGECAWIVQVLYHFSGKHEIKRLFSEAFHKRVIKRGTVKCHLRECQARLLNSRLREIYPMTSPRRLSERSQHRAVSTAQVTHANIFQPSAHTPKLRQQIIMRMITFGVGESVFDIAFSAAHGIECRHSVIVPEHPSPCPSNSARMIQRSRVRFLILLLPSLPLGVFSQTTQNSTANKTVDIQGAVLEATANTPIRKALVTLQKGSDAGIGTYTDEAAGSSSTTSSLAPTSFLPLAPASWPIPKRVHKPSPSTLAPQSNPSRLSSVALRRSPAA